MHGKQVQLPRVSKKEPLGTDWFIAAGSVGMRVDKWRQEIPEYCLSYKLLPRGRVEQSKGK